MADSILVSSDDSRWMPWAFEVNNTVEEDKKDIESLINSAKFGKWDGVYSILGSPINQKKSFLINCIPENRRWAVIHQAVYWNNEKEIATLMNFTTFDINAKTKPGISEVGEDGGLAACEIAKRFGYTQIERLLETSENYIYWQPLDTFQKYEFGKENEFLGLVRITLGAYKNTFHPNRVDPSKPLLAVLKDVFLDMNSSEARWKEIRDKVCQSLGTFSLGANEKLTECGTRKQFYKAIINAYTIEENRLYDTLNTALRRQRRHEYMPTAVDLAVGPYVVVYQMLLMYWDKLDCEMRTTFRKMKVSKGDASKYNVGTKFIWLSFVSSSVIYEKATAFPTVAPSGVQAVIFEIDNRKQSHWQPRNIERFAEFMENERIYPPGSRFLVTGKNVAWNGDIWIRLTLLPE